MIYADYQATTPVDPRVLRIMEPHWNTRFGNPHSSEHAVGWRAAESVRTSASRIAALIGSDPDEIVFTSGATEANNLAIIGVAHASSSKRKRILVSAIEHKCVLASARYLAEREGFVVEVIPVDEHGVIDIDALAAALDDDVLMCSVMAVNNEIGTIQDVALIGEMLREQGVIFHCDAAQAPCAMDVDELAMHADLISLSGHKMYGPPGIGALCVRRDLHDSIGPIMHGGGQQGGLRSGTLPMPLCVGFAAAAEIMMTAESQNERRRLGQQRDAFVQQLKSNGLPVVINGPPSGSRHPGNANIRFEGQDAQDLLSALQPSVAASSGSACTSGIPEPSHVLRAIGLTDDQAESSIRFSFGRFTNDDEIEGAAQKCIEVLCINRSSIVACGFSA